MTRCGAEAGSGLVLAFVVVDAVADGWRPHHRPVRRLHRRSRLVVEGYAAVRQNSAHRGTAKNILGQVNSARKPKYRLVI